MGIYVAGIYEWIRFDGQKNNPDLANLNVFHLILDLAWLNKSGL